MSCEKRQAVHPVKITLGTAWAGLLSTEPAAIVDLLAERTVIGFRQAESQAGTGDHENGVFMKKKRLGEVLRERKRISEED